MNTPVAFIVFNRLEVARRVFARIREARPSRLFVIADGPRPDRPDDLAKVAAVRALIDGGVDWPCDVVRDYSAHNIGCRDRIHSGLGNVFARTEEAIILEDDCLPDPSFFEFCARLLRDHRDTPEVMNIGGTNLAAPQFQNMPESHWFTRHVWIWGWASWRRAWALDDHHMTTWEQRLPTVRRTFASAWERQYWLSTWEAARRDLVTTNAWDFPWMYSVRSLNGLAILPADNLVENLGFGIDSTHTGPEAARLHLPATPSRPHRAPARMTVDRYRDEMITRAYADAGFDLRTNLRSRWRTTFRP